MERLPLFSLYRRLILVLGVIMLGTSCGQSGDSIIPTAAGEVLAQGNIDPSFILSSNYIFCPLIPTTAINIPPAPFNEQIGDCSLRGKSAEIESWLTALEQIAATCQANGEINWAATLAAREYLDSKLDGIGDLMTLIMPAIETGDDEETPGGRLRADAFEILNLRAQTDCPGYPSEPMDPFSGGGGEMSNPYISMLTSISENVEKYCTMTDKIIEPLWQACDEINFYQDCQAPNLQQYYAIVETKMNLAQVNYDQAALFYINTLQNGGWDGFRSAFNPASLDCPLDPQAPDTKFTFNQNAFCRRGPSIQYEKVASFFVGQEVQIEGRNHHEPRWWVVPNPGARGQCWVSDSTGAAEGPLEELLIVAPPPLVINKPENDQTNTCSKDLGPSACTAAGGTMAGGATSAPYCDCP